jgi:hypothetical protein
MIADVLQLMLAAVLVFAFGLVVRRMLNRRDWWR